jgi:hypothetical protein
MKRPLAVLALATLLGAAGPLPADEVPHLEFVRELRARYPDLALEYLNKLDKSKLPPEVAAVIPLEIAKVKLDLATGESDTKRRLKLYEEASAEFDKFIKNNPNNLLVADALVDQARVKGLQAKAELSRALRDEDSAARVKGAAVARATFVQGSAQLQAAADQLTRDIGKYPNPQTQQEKDTKRALQQAQLQAQLDIGLNYLDQAQTYVGGGEDVSLARSKVVVQAQTQLEKVANDKEAGAGSPVVWQARTWAAYCDILNGDPGKANRKFDDIIGHTEPAAAAGRRLALFFKMRSVFDEGRTPKEAEITQVKKDAEAWVQDHRTYLGTPEGCGVRYYLAYVLFLQAGEAKDKDVRTQYLKRARDLCADLTRSDNDYKDKARALAIDVIGAEGGFKKEISKLTTFDECLVRADYEAAQAQKLAAAESAKPEAVEKQRKTHIDNAVDALKLGLDYAGRPGAKASPPDVGRARSMLCGYYLFMQKYKEAIAVGDEAARAVPPTVQSARTAMYVIEAYNDLIQESLRTGTTLADLSEPKGPVERMNELALFMENKWPAEPPGNVARHMRGLLLVKQKKLTDAVKLLSEVTPDYPAIIYVKASLFAAANQVAQDREALAKAEPDKSKKEPLLKEQAQYEQQALDALKTMPALPAKADPVTTGIYLNAKVELARAHYRRKEFTEIDKVVQPVLDGIANGSIKLDASGEKKPTATEQARTSLLLVQLYGKYGAAEAEFAAGHADKVKAILDPLMKEIGDGKRPELDENPDLRWGLMGLALRVSIQGGDIEAALKIYDAAKKAAGKQAGEKGGKLILLQVASVVKAQAREARKKKDDAAIKKYGEFLDKLRGGEKDPSPEFRLVMAEAYESLGQYDSAVEQARLVPEPAADEKDERKLSVYRQARFLCVRCLRLAGKKDECKAELAELRKTRWGKDPQGKELPEVVKEAIHLEPPGKAYGQWSSLVNQLAAKIQQPGVKDQYFECYFYMTECLVNYAKNQKGAKVDEYMKRAAERITKLEANWKDLGGDESKARFTDLLAREPALKDQYDKLKNDQ